MNDIASNNKKDIWFVYDGECPLCQIGARHFRIEQAVGKLHLLDARRHNNDPVMREINAQKLDLDQGMVIKIGDRLYHGVDALHIMAFIGSNQGWLNRMNALLFKSKTMARLCYPLMKAARNLALWFKGVGKIKNL